MTTGFQAAQAEVEGALRQARRALTEPAPPGASPEARLLACCRSLQAVAAQVAALREGVESKRAAHPGMREWLEGMRAEIRTLWPLIRQVVDFRASLSEALVRQTRRPEMAALASGYTPEGLTEAPEPARRWAVEA